MNNFPTCNTCNSKMTIYDGCSWYTCPKCENRVRDNDNGTWTWYEEIFINKSKSNRNLSDFELANICRGGDLTED